MQHGSGGKRPAFLPYKGMVLGLILIVLTCVFAVASAESAGSFSGRVWNDLNNDGLMDDTEPGVEGVTLLLTRSDNGEVYTATSDSSGAYAFTALPNDSYAFSIEVPDSMLYARYRKEGSDLRSVFTGEDLDITRSYTVRSSQSLSDINVGLIDSAIIKGIVFLDLNYNGKYDEGEPPCEGVTMEVIRNASDRSMGKLVTDADGTFYFNNVRTGNYRLRAILPDDGSTFTYVPDELTLLSNQFAARAGHRENSIASIDVENSMVYEYYVGVAIGGTISGTVYNDKDYSGALNKSDSKLSGVNVQLVGTDGTVVAETSTSAKGTYTFSEVMPGDYILRFERKDGYTFTKYRPDEEGGNSALLTQAGDYGETDSFTFTMGEDLTGCDAGLVQSATLSGIFFYDENDNGLMDDTEGGFTDGLVRLLSDDGEIDLTQTVNADGSYYFGGVVPTSYTLYYILPEHAEMAQVVSGGNTLKNQGLENAVTGLSLKAKKNYTQPLVGAVKLGTFAGCAFTDLNANGVLDAGEATLAGVTVALQAGSADAFTAVTGADGLFSLTGLRPDNYTLSLILPNGMIFSSDILSSQIALERTDDYAASVPFSTLLNRAENQIGAVAPATLQASVWLDENRNGVQDADERLLSDLEYALYDEVNQKYIMTARSDDGGIAVFSNVRPSTYTVSFTLPDDAQPVAGVGTFTQDGGTMRQSGIVIGSCETYTNISGGVVCTTSLGGTVVADESDGRIPVEGVTVMLYAQDSSQMLQSTTTDAQGTYRFDGLWPGSYVVEVVRPSGWVFIRPNDPALQTVESIITQINDEYGTSDPITLEMAQDQLQHQVLLTIPAKVGSLVWLDENQNGLMDIDEPTINGVTINLLQNGITAYTTTSNAWGYYEFADVYPGEYTLEAVAYPELTITTALSQLPMISSCLVSGDGTLALSEPFTVTSESVNFFYQLGYVLKDGETIPSAITEGAHQLWPQSETDAESE